MLIPRSPMNEQGINEFETESPTLATSYESIRERMARFDERNASDAAVDNCGCAVQVTL